MKTKPKGIVHRGSVIHQILTELERYPDTWYRWFQFPGLDAQQETIRRSMFRLVTIGRVESRLVLDEQPDGRHRNVSEIRWKDYEKEN